MSPQRMIDKLQKEWDEHPEYTKDGFADYVCEFVGENDEVGYLFENGEQVSVLDYVMNKISFGRN